MTNENEMAPFDCRSITEEIYMATGSERLRDEEQRDADGNVYDSVIFTAEDFRNVENALQLAYDRGRYDQGKTAADALNAVLKSFEETEKENE